MAKICPKCGAAQTDVHYIMCASCKVAYVEEESVALNLSPDALQEIVKKLLRSVRFWCLFGVGMILVALGVVEALDWLTGRNLRTLTAELERSSSNQLAVAYGEITNQIVAEFKEPRISQTVSSVAASEAQSILRGQVSPVVEQFKRDVSDKLDASLKEIDARLKAQDPMRQSIVSAMAKAEVTIKSGANEGGHFIDVGGMAALAAGTNGLILVSSVDSFGNQTGNGEVVYLGVFAMPAGGTAIGKPIDSLKEAEYVQVEFGKLPADSLVIRGKVEFIINNFLSLKFEIPQQKALGRKVFVRDLGVGLKAVRESK